MFSRRQKRFRRLERAVSQRPASLFDCTAILRFNFSLLDDLVEMFAYFHYPTGFVSSVVFIGSCSRVSARRQR